MKIFNTALSLLAAASLDVYAQTEADTTDIFYGHVTLNEAVVTGVTGQTRLKESPVPVLLVPESTLRHTPSTNILGAIARQPGFSQLTTGNGIAKPVIRGLGYNRIVCLADGVRQEGQQWGDEHGLELDGSDVQSVEIIKGPASLMYGSDAMAGVVIFHPQPSRPSGSIGGSASGEYQTNSGLWAYSLNFGGNQHGLTWDARWSQRAAHAYKTPVDGYVPGSQFAEQALRTRLGLERQWGHSRLTLSYYHQRPGIIEGERDEQTGELDAPDSWRGRSYGKTLPFQHIHHYKAVSDNSWRIGTGQLKAIVGYQHNRRQEYEESPSECGLDFLLHTLTYDTRYHMAEYNGWKLTGGLGGMYQGSMNKGDEYLIPAYHLWDLGIFLTGSKRLGDVMLSGGVRYDNRHLRSESLDEDGVQRFQDFRRTFRGLTGSVGAVWNAARGLDVRFNLARGFRAPNLAELASNGIHEGTARYETGDAMLRPEYSWQADLGLTYQNHLLSLQAAMFANRIDNYIYIARGNGDVDGTPIYHYTAGDARLWGFEVGLDLHPIHALHLENTFSYVNAVQLHQPHAARHLPLTPAPHWTSEIKWELTHKPRKMGRSSMAWQNAFLALTVDTYWKQNRYDGVEETETATSGYALLALGVGGELLWRGRKVMDVYLCADNLLNKAYQSHLSRLKYMDANALTGRRGVWNPGRNVTLRMTIPFGR